MKKTSLTLSLLLTLFASGVWGDWEFIGKSDAGSSFYIDYDSIEKKEGHIYFWYLMDEPEANLAGYKSIKSYEKIDCKDSRRKALEAVFYKHPMGQEPGDSKTPPGKFKEWQNIPLGTAIAAVFKRVCNFEDIS